VGSLTASTRGPNFLQPHNSSRSAENVTITPTLLLPRVAGRAGRRKPTKGTSVAAKAAGKKRTKTLHEIETHTLPFDRIPQYPALTDGCRTCADDVPAAIHVVNPGVTPQITLGDFTCPSLADQYHVMQLVCLCPVSGIVAQLIHAAQTHEIHVHLQNHFFRWWPIYEFALQRSNVSYTVIRNSTEPRKIPAQMGNGSSYSDVYKVLPVYHQSRSMCKGCLRDLAYQYNNVPFDAPCSSVLFISRKKSRRIVDEDALMAGLSKMAERFNLPLEVYYGHESPPELTLLFSRKYEPLHTCMIYIVAAHAILLQHVCVQAHVPW
jgi:hypothetical protein